MGKRLRILISAHEVSPRLGSECSSGWHLITRLGALHDVTVLFAATNQFQTNSYQEHIDEYYRSTKAPRNVRFIPVAQPWGTRAIAWVNRLVSPRRTSVGVPALYFLAYRLWQRSAFQRARELANYESFDVVHQSERDLLPRAELSVALGAPVHLGADEWVERGAMELCSPDARSLDPRSSWNDSGNRRQPF